MAFISLTRLRLRSAIHLPAFAVHAVRSQRQLRIVPGFLAGELVPDRKLTFWTLTAWNSEAAMWAYVRSGAHLRAMPRLMRWCDEASVVHWEQPGTGLPSWQEADERMRTQGRPSKVLRPSAAHASLAYAARRTRRRIPVRPS